MRTFLLIVTLPVRLVIHVLHAMVMSVLRVLVSLCVVVLVIYLALAWFGVLEVEWIDSLRRLL